VQIPLQQKIRETGDAGGGQEVGFDGLGVRVLLMVGAFCSYCLDLSVDGA
jgi:hypothetical protein